MCRPYHVNTPRMPRLLQEPEGAETGSGFGVWGRGRAEHVRTDLRGRGLGLGVSIFSFVCHKPQTTAPFPAPLPIRVDRKGSGLTLHHRNTRNLVRHGGAR